MKGRAVLELALLAVGVGFGIWAVSSRDDPSPPPATSPSEAPRAVASGRITTSWPRSRGDAGLTGRTADALPRAVALAWTYATRAPILSSPAVADGRVVVGSNDDHVHCVDAATGSPVWTYRAGADVEAPPLVIDGRVFVGAVDGKLHAIDASNGKGLWTYATGDKILGGANARRAANGKLRVYVGSYDHELHCVDADTGEGVWTFETENYVNGTPAISEDVVVFGGCDGFLRVVDADTGRTRRDVVLGEDVYVASSVAVEGGVAYVAHVDRACVAVRLASGETLWTFTSKEGYFSSPALGDSRVVVGGRDKVLRALNRVTGKLLWSFTCRADLDSSPVIAGDRVVVGSDDGRVYAIDLESGEPVWEYALGGPVTGSVAVAGGMVFVGCEDGTLYALGARR